MGEIVKNLTTRDVLGYGLLVVGITFGITFGASALVGFKLALILVPTTIAIYGVAWALKSVLKKYGTRIESRSGPGDSGG